MFVSVVMYARFGISNTQIALFTSLLNLPWVIKPLWGPLVDLYSTKRRWVTAMQFLLAIAFGMLAFSLNLEAFWTASLIVFGVASFLSATHDIAADGFYMLGLDQHRQALFVGIRSTFYRIAVITGQGVLIIFVGIIESRTGPEPTPIIVQSGGAVAQAPADLAMNGDKAILAEPQILSLDPGTTAAVAITLAQAPQTTRAVTVEMKYSNWVSHFLPVGTERLFKVEGGDRIEFSPENWNVPQMITVQVDDQLEKPASAVLVARSGNIRLSWTFCFAAMSTLFLVLTGWHTFILPHPAIDAPTAAGDRPPFARAAGWLFGAVFVPVWLLISAFYGVRNHAAWLLTWLSNRFGMPSGQFVGPFTYADITGIALTILLLGLVLMAVARLSRKGAMAGGGSQKNDRFHSARWGLDLIILAIAGVVLFFGLRPALELWWVWAGLTKYNDVITFITDILLVALVYLFYRSQTVRTNSLQAFKGASIQSGIPFAEVFISFFQKPGIGRMVAFLLLYRLGEAMLVKIATPFLIKAEEGALGLSTTEYGLAYGVLGILGLVVGGILGGVVAARHGLKRWIFWMCLAINAPDLLYVYLAYAMPDNFLVIVGCVALEQFGYGFGFAAYMLYQLYIAGEGEHKTSHFAICTGLMALGMMLPGMVSGAIQEAVGYPNFFIIVCIATIPGFLTLLFIPLDPEFGKRKSS